WSNYRDCHIRPDLVLIYRLIGQDRLVLVRLGSHAKLDL
ncbi:type II toxin-antitoxin system mRNA interferase toxin, RelE/StbE family, partial [Bartonella sp. AA33NXGY]